VVFEHDNKNSSSASAGRGLVQRKARSHKEAVRDCAPQKLGGAPSPEFLRPSSATFPLQTSGGREEPRGKGPNQVSTHNPNNKKVFHSTGITGVLQYGSPDAEYAKQYLDSVIRLCHHDVSKLQTLNAEKTRTIHKLESKVVVLKQRQVPARLVPLIIRRPRFRLRSGAKQWRSGWSTGETCTSPATG
jgi:hypothetical protein